MRTLRALGRMVGFVLVRRVCVAAQVIRGLICVEVMVEVMVLMFKDGTCRVVI